MKRIQYTNIPLFKSHSLIDMFKNRNLKFILPVLFAILAFGIKVARAEDDDDDNIIVEIVTDLFVGALVGACQSNEACNAVLGTFCMFFLFIAVILWCASGCECSSPSGRDFRRAGTMYVGSRLTRR